MYHDSVSVSSSSIAVTTVIADTVLLSLVCIVAITLVDVLHGNTVAFAHKNSDQRAER